MWTWMRKTLKLQSVSFYKTFSRLNLFKKFEQLDSYICQTLFDYLKYCFLSFTRSCQDLAANFFLCHGGVCLLSSRQKGISQQFCIYRMVWRGLMPPHCTMYFVYCQGALVALAAVSSWRPGGVQMTRPQCFHWSKISV